MTILITGICGFVGSRVALALQEQLSGLEIIGIDNFIRPGSETNRTLFKKRNVRLLHGDIRMASDLENLPPLDWIIDAAANPSVLAGIDGSTSSRQLIEHNLLGTVNLLELCKAHRASFILLSTSRVYSIPPLASLPVQKVNGAYEPDPSKPLPSGISAEGISEEFSTRPPVSLYGATKVASEALALEYGSAFDFPVWINRCGVLAGAGQFGRPDQGIFAYWINSWLRKRPLRYLGFDGTGAQARDVLHPRDLAGLIKLQMNHHPSPNPLVWNIGGGRSNTMSLAQLSHWCAHRFASSDFAISTSEAIENRPFDIPWMVMDSRRAEKEFGWTRAISLEEILEEIAVHAEANPHWLELSAPL